VKERRGTVSRLTGLAEGVAASARRRQRDRAPRVLVYDDAGHPAVLASDDPSFDALVSAAERMIDIAEGGAPDGGDHSSTGGVSVPEPRTDGDSE
jgi:hypothetical protein